MKQLLLALLLVPLLSFSQESLEKELDSINSIEEAKSFAKTYKKANKSKVFTFNKEKHKTRLADDLFKLSEGNTKTVKSENKKTVYKVIAKSKTPHYKVRYIFFDGNKLTLEEINDKRYKIISQYQKGYTFSKLAKIHSMDINAKRGGDSGWFPEGKMHPKFEEAVKENDKNTIFTLDIEDKKWHYIILKTQPKKIIEEITVLQYSEAID
jgi:parvulin-like peptidyl-prolyl isomerase